MTEEQFDALLELIDAKISAAFAHQKDPYSETDRVHAAERLARELLVEDGE